MVAASPCDMPSAFGFPPRGLRPLLPFFLLVFSHRIGADFDPERLRVYHNALPLPLLAGLAEEVEAIKAWEDAHWWPRFDAIGAPRFASDHWIDLVPSPRPRIRSEEAILHLARLVFPDGLEASGIVGAEWWAMRTDAVTSVELHHDKDECAFRDELYPCSLHVGAEGPCPFHHPALGSILYVDEFGAPTVILDSNITTQGAGADEEIGGAWLAYPEKNKYITFPGSLQHFVFADLTPQDAWLRRGGRRFTFLVNWWRTGPLRARNPAPDYVPFSLPASTDNDEVAKNVSLPLKAPLGLAPPELGWSEPPINVVGPLGRRANSSLAVVSAPGISGSLAADAVAAAAGAIEEEKKGEEEPPSSLQFDYTGPSQSWYFKTNRGLAFEIPLVMRLTLPTELPALSTFALRFDQPTPPPPTQQGAATTRSCGASFRPLVLELKELEARALLQQAGKPANLTSRHKEPPTLLLVACEVQSDTASTVVVAETAAATRDAFVRALDAVAPSFYAFRSQHSYGIPLVVPAFHRTSKCGSMRSSPPVDGMFGSITGPLALWLVDSDQQQVFAPRDLSAWISEARQSSQTQGGSAASGRLQELIFDWVRREREAYW